MGTTGICVNILRRRKEKKNPSNITTKGNNYNDFHCSFNDNELTNKLNFYLNQTNIQDSFFDNKDSDDAIFNQIKKE